jgi:O-antigen/teichoic acid export membrane protein
MFYNLPISIIGLTLSTLLIDSDRMHRVLNIMPKILKWNLIFILCSFIIVTWAFKGDNFLLNLFINFFAGKIADKHSLLKIMSIYIPGIIPAIIVVVFAKVYLLKNRVQLLFKIYMLGLIIKFLLTLIFVNLGYDGYICVSLSTTLSWLLVSLLLIYHIRTICIVNIHLKDSVSY